MGRHARVYRILASAILALGAGAPSQTYRPPEHAMAVPLFSGATPEESQAYANAGVQIEWNRPAAWTLAEHRRLDRALAIAPERKSVVDAYVVVAGLDSDPVFGREAREAAKVLARRYDAAGRTILLAGTDGSADSDAPRGSPDNLALALARVAETMDRNEDVLVLYTTSHGAPWGVFYSDGDSGAGAISPVRLWALLSQLGITNRLLLMSACYSGAFVPVLESDTTAIVTASSATRTSFGCQADSDWTFFGDAMINHAFRKPQSLADAAAEATRSIGAWEARGKLKPSEPQTNIGAGAARWLAALDARMPKEAASAPVGRPATTILGSIVPH